MLLPRCCHRRLIAERCGAGNGNGHGNGIYVLGREKRLPRLLGLARRTDNGDDNGSSKDDDNVKRDIARCCSSSSVGPSSVPLSIYLSSYLSISSAWPGKRHADGEPPTAFDTDSFRPRSRTATSFQKQAVTLPVCLLAGRSEAVRMGQTRRFLHTDYSRTVARSLARSFDRPAGRPVARWVGTSAS